MKRTYSTDVKKKKSGDTVNVAGWVDEKRLIGKLIFLVVRDAKGSVQVTAKEQYGDIFYKLKNLHKEDVVSITGTVIENKEAPDGVEIKPDNIKMLAVVKEALPIDMSGKIHTMLDKRLDFRSLDLRSQRNQAIFKIQSTMLHGMISFLDKNGFVQVFTPCLMGAASEGGSEVFSLDYFDKKAFLRQDPQLHRQLTIAGGFEKIYDIGPSWRAELSHTTRHLCEHRTCAVEMAFIKDEYDVIELEEGLVRTALERVIKDCKQELELFNVKLEVSKKFPVLEFPKIYDILEKMGKPCEYGKDYDTESEKLLYEYVKKKYDSDFFFVNRFPFAVKPFYVMRVDEEPQWARSVDLIYKGVELSSGGQREHRYDKIISQVKEKGLSLDSVKWFTEFFKYGVPPHGGFAIGLERLVKQLLGLENIREAVLFPRAPERLEP
jgi:aspartyl-tRNA synthetase